MVTTFGNSIFGAYTNGKQVREIYTYGEKVWPETYSGYYIKWSPADLSGSFTMGGETRWLQDYSGFYSGPFLSKNIRTESGSIIDVMVIDALAFASTGVLAIDTNVEYISRYAFKDCSSLYYINMPNVVRTDIGIFSSCSQLGEVELPELEVLSIGTFTYCTNLYEVSLPKVKWIGLDGTALGGCYNLHSLYLPECRIIDGLGLGYTGLSIIELPVCSRINEEAFKGSPSLHTVILGYSSVTLLTNTDAFESTQITPTRGSIYVPLSLVSEYKNASRWSYFSAIIQPIPHP